MVIDSRQKRFVMNMQLRQSFARAKPFPAEKSENFKMLLLKSKISNPV